MQGKIAQLLSKAHNTFFFFFSFSSFFFFYFFFFNRRYNPWCFTISFHNQSPQHRKFKINF
jgi:hypothetical protein